MLKDEVDRRLGGEEKEMKVLVILAVWAMLWAYALLLAAFLPPA